MYALPDFILSSIISIWSSIYFILQVVQLFVKIKKDNYCIQMFDKEVISSGKR